MSFATANRAFVTELRGWAVLALITFCTRRLNWYSLEMNAVTASEADDR